MQTFIYITNKVTPSDGEYQLVCEQICELVQEAGNGLRPFSNALKDRINSLQEKRRV